VFTETAVHKN